MSWLYYLLEANLYLIIFYGFYKLILQKETFYALNRYYLIFSTVLAFILPFFQLGFLKEPIISEPNLVFTPEIDQVNYQNILVQTQVQASVFTFENIIITLYAVVVFFLLFKFLFSLSKIIKLQKVPFIVLENGIKLIHLQKSKSAFSFFNLLFLDPQLPEKNTILKHELVHIRQKHSIDVLFFEVLQIINWFNPIIYLLKKDVKLIHEYLADEETTNAVIEKYDYALFLIKNSSAIQNMAIINQIFSSSVLKKRISMLNQKKSPKWARLKLLFVLPITAGILCISTMAFTKEYGFVELTSQRAILQDSVLKNKKTAPPIVKKDKPLMSRSPNTPSKKHKKIPPPIVKPDQRTSLTKLNDATNKSLSFYIDRSRNQKLVFPKTANKASITVANRWGNEVYKNENYLNDWNGQSENITEGTYFFVYSEINDQEKVVNTLKGWVSILDSIGELQPPVVAKNIVVLPPPPIVEPDPRKKANLKSFRKVNKQLPPAIVTPDNQTYFYTKNTYGGELHNAIKVDQRYIIVNSKPIEDNSNFHGVRNTESVKYLSQSEATKKYGTKGKYGVVEIIGENLSYLPKPTPLPFPKITLNRSKNEMLIIPNSDFESKTLTVYDKKGKIIYNTTAYNNDWNGQKGNYGVSKLLPAGNYQYLMKIVGQPRSNKRGVINITD